VESAVNKNLHELDSLHANEEIFNLFIDHAPAALAMFDREMRYLKASKRWCEDYGTGDRDIIGVSHYEVFPEIPERWKSVHCRGLAGETIRSDEERFEREDGTCQWLRWEVLPWHLSDGAIGGIIIFSEDITRFKLAEDEIRSLNAILEQRVVERTAQLIAEIEVRKQTEQVLQQYAAIIESSDDAIIGETLETMITSWNNGAARMFGYTRDEVLGQSIRILIPEEFQHEEVIFLEQVSRGERVEHYRTVRRHKDGRMLDISVTLSPIRDLEGTIVGASKVAHDITKHKLAEDALKVSEERFRGAFETAAHGMALVSLEGKFIKVNKSLCAILGYGDAELLATDFQTITHPDDLHADLQYLQQLLEKEIENFQMEKRFFHKNGNIAWVLLSVSIVRTSPGTSLHFVAHIQDITLPKAAEQELRIAAATFETQDAIMITDANANIIKVNRAFTTLTGYQPEEVLGRNASMMNSGRHSKAFFASLFNQVSHDGSWVGEIWDKRKNGEIYPRWMTITAVRDTQQKISQFVGIFSDITERKKNEALINKMAYYDPLTQLPNRRMFRDRLAQHGLSATIRASRGRDIAAACGQLKA
jgi:PAS domain S-box-containing protein